MPEDEVEIVEDTGAPAAEVRPAVAPLPHARTAEPIFSVRLCAQAPAGAKTEEELLKPVPKPDEVRARALRAAA